MPQRHLIKELSGLFLIWKNTIIHLYCNAYSHLVITSQTVLSKSTSSPLYNWLVTRLYIVMTSSWRGLTPQTLLHDHWSPSLVIIPSASVWTSHPITATITSLPTVWPRYGAHSLVMAHAASFWRSVSTACTQQPRSGHRKPILDVVILGLDIIFPFWTRVSLWNPWPQPQSPTPSCWLRNSDDNFPSQSVLSQNELSTRLTHSVKNRSDWVEYIPCIRLYFNDFGHWHRHSCSSLYSNYFIKTSVYSW